VETSNAQDAGCGAAARAAARTRTGLTAACAQENELLYERELEAAAHDDFSDLRASDFLRLGATNNAGSPVVILVAHKLPSAGFDAERVFRFICLTCDSVADAPFSVLYVHTSTVWHSPGALWLRSAYERCATPGSSAPLRARLSILRS